MSHPVGMTTTNYVWHVAAGLPVVLQDGENTYVYGLDLISATDGQGNQTYFLYDGLGSVTDVTDENGDAVASYSYDVFGAIRGETGSSDNYWLFTGEQNDADSDLYYLRARYYDPAIGRFLGRDPLDVGHAYAYVENAPANYIDPKGTCRVEVRAKRLSITSRIGIPDGYHLFIYTQDPTDNSEIAYRGGPNRRYFDPFFGLTPATVRAAHGDWEPGFRDYSSSRNDPTAVVADTGGSCAGIRASFDNKEGKINAAKVPYDPFGTNSNWTVRVLLHAAGLPEVLPETNCFKWEENPVSRLFSDVFSGGCKNSVWAPGWDEPSFIP